MLTDIGEELYRRVQAIATIEALYPIDSQHEDTAAIGEKLLTATLWDAFEASGKDWRTLPSDVLFILETLCKEEAGE